MKIIPLLIASTALMMSCEKKSLTTQENNSVTPTADSVSTTVDSTSTADAAVLTPETSVAKNNTAVKPALNPAHGEPFHRCDIAVGAPIDSAPQQAAAPQAIQQQAPANNFNTSPMSPSVTSSALPVQATGPKPALNPAHGEPHHRCDLQVGAPLT